MATIGLEKKIENLIDYLLEHDQPTSEIARQIVRIVDEKADTTSCFNCEGERNVVNPRNGNHEICAICEGLGVAPL